MSYDEFSYFAENAAEAGLELTGPPVVRRAFVEVGTHEVGTEVMSGDARRLSALVWGEEPAQFVFLHGGGQNAHTWDTVLLALRHPAVAIDLPGHGHSDGPDPMVTAIEGYSRDVATVIRVLAPQARVLVGMSAGGLTAIALTALAPELVGRLMLVDVLPEPDPAAARAILDFLDGPETFDSFEEILQRTVRYNPGRSVSSLRRGILHNALELPDGIWQWRHRRHRRALRPPDPDEAAQLAAALWADLRAITVPVRLVRGLAEGSVVTDGHVATLREVLPSADVVGVPGAGHSVQGDQPVRLAELVEQFARGDAVLTRKGGQT
jgi:pimeloyl-ACP methyl ester carboxylesterase